MKSIIKFHAKTQKLLTQANGRRLLNLTCDNP